MIKRTIKFISSTLCVVAMSVSISANASNIIKYQDITITEQQGIMACALGPMGDGDINKCILEDKDDKPGDGSGVTGPAGMEQTCYNENDENQSLVIKQCDAYQQSKL